MSDEGMSLEMKAIKAIADHVGVELLVGEGRDAVPLDDKIYSRANASKEHVITVRDKP